ncbi:hypothetical protein CLV98_1071 [Dyadobacter jejuensis]|uniref:WYL domain-containing protein n=1 Tax=Dyadobacter jejuensis TaxID=1082580 RepID=A0A316AHS2_9BACT|nr:hypothetical protein [Dyadobacter jejuensis]PWJ57295.1 hypothetical protein CLV98_1071 [Dyadobacter jejuensis]
MAKKEGDGTVAKLRRIIIIHQVLRNQRSGKVISTAYLAQKCSEQGWACDVRTMADDLKLMKDVLHAPLPARANKHTGYYYTEPYSLLDSLDNSYHGQLNEIVALVRRLANEKEFAGLEDLLLRLEQRNQITTDIEKNELISFEEVKLKGKDQLLPLYRHIQQGDFLVIDYRPYNQEKEIKTVFPVMLKEYNSRWYVIGCIFCSILTPFW